MLIDGKIHRVFEFKNLSSIAGFSEWLKDNLTIYDDDKKIPNNNLIKHLTYLKEQAKDQRVAEKRKWLDKIDELLERLEKDV
jgi:hypothetical protein